MKRYYSNGRIPTLEVALTEHMNADYLKKLAKHTNQKIPTRKAGIAAVIKQYLVGERLKAVWQVLDDLQRAAVAEVVHSSSTHFLADRFAAKYGRSPNWGSAGKYGYRRNPSPLAFFFYGGVMPDDLKARLKAFVPKPAAAKVRTMSELPAADHLPWSRWNSKTRTEEKGTEEVPLAVYQTELTAQRELLSVLRLIDSGKVSVSDKTRRPSAATIKAITNVLGAATTTRSSRSRASGRMRTQVRFAPLPGRSSCKPGGSRSSRAQSCSSPRPVAKHSRSLPPRPYTSSGPSGSIRPCSTNCRASSASRGRPARASEGSPPCRPAETPSPTPLSSAFIPRQHVYPDFRVDHCIKT